MSIAATWSARLKDVWANGVVDNPVVAKELRTRMRGRKGFMVMGGYVLFLGIVLLISYYTMWIISARNLGGMQSLVNVKLGQKLFMSLNWTQTILLALIIPSLTSGALTLELEKKTIEMLVLTRLTSGVVVLGKHLTGMLYALILLMCSLPLSGICLMFGGISPAEMVVTYLLLIAWTFLLSAIGVFWSSLFNRTAAAVLMTYGTVAGFMLTSAGSGAALMQSIWYLHGGSSANAMALLNPGWAPWGALMNASVCGVKVPICIPPIVLYFIYGSAMLLIAAMHVRYLRAEKALPARILMIAGTLFGIWLTFGDSTYTVPVTELNVWMSGMLFVFAALLVPLLATGPMPAKDGKLSIADFLDPRRMFKSDISGAFCFIVLWAVLGYAAFGITLFWQKLIAGAGPFGTIKWPGVFQVGISSLVVVAAMAAIALAASAAMKARRNAVALSFLISIVIFAAYGVILANYHHGLSDPGNAIWQLAALWPITPLITASNGWHSTMPTLWWPKSMSWLLVSGIYGAITLALLLAAPRLAAKSGGVQEEQY